MCSGQVDEVYMSATARKLYASALVTLFPPPSSGGDKFGLSRDPNPMNSNAEIWSWVLDIVGDVAGVVAQSLDACEQVAMMTSPSIANLDDDDATFVFSENIRDAFVEDFFSPSSFTFLL